MVRDFISVLLQRTLPRAIRKVFLIISILVFSIQALQGEKVMKPTLLAKLKLFFQNNMITGLLGMFTSVRFFLKIHGLFFQAIFREGISVRQGQKDAHS